MDNKDRELDVYRDTPVRYLGNIINRFLAMAIAFDFIKKPYDDIKKYFNISKK